MTANVESLRIVSAEINTSGLIKISDLRDFMELIDEAPEESYVAVLTDELRYEVGT